MTSFASTIPIFTLNARENIFLELAREGFGVPPDEIQGGIWALHDDTRKALAAKGLDYAHLKSALIPKLHGEEAGFIFDTRRIDSGFYGWSACEAVLPLLDRRSIQSVLCGDLVGRDEENVLRIIKQLLVPARPLESRYSHILYCVYINNLSPATLQRLHAGLSAMPGYIGFLPTTFESPAKTYLSTVLVNDFIKYRACAIMKHEDDRPSTENVDLMGHPFEEFGYTPLSLQEMYFNLFLSYKIERPVYRGFEADTEMSLNALAPTLVPMGDLTVQLDEAKYGYLTTKKVGKLRKAGIVNLRRDQIVTLIKRRIASNYIYNLALKEDWNVATFNLMLEFRRPEGYPTRVLAALEYRPRERLVRVITLF